jgi:hypothetical protein
VAISRKWNPVLPGDLHPFSFFHNLGTGTGTQRIMSFHERWQPVAEVTDY